MGAAAAQIEFELGADLRFGRFGVPLQQGLRPHHHAGDAVAALRRLLVDEGLLQLAGPLGRAEALDRGDAPAFDARLVKEWRRDVTSKGTLLSSPAVTR